MSRAKIAAQTKRGMHSDFTVQSHQLKVMLAFYEAELARCRRFGSYLVPKSGNRGAETQCFSCTGGFQDQHLSVARSCCQIHSTGTDDEDPSGRLTFDKEDRAGR